MMSPELPQGALSVVDLPAELEAIQNLAAHALWAIAEEHESELTAAVVLIRAKAELIAELVARW